MLFGDYNPLDAADHGSALRWPAAGLLLPEAFRKREFLGTTTKPLFPFGWGLSYTSFKYDNLHLTPDHMGPQGATKVSVDVTNTGKVTGQKSSSSIFATKSARLRGRSKELRGFRRMSLAPGETKTVEFQLGPEELVVSKP